MKQNFCTLLNLFVSRSWSFRQLSVLPTILLAFTIFAAAGDVNAQAGASYYAAPNGSAAGTGSITSPWDLKTALSQTTAIQPGAILYLRGGTYTVSAANRGYVSNLVGTSANPITVTSYPGEWAVIDGNLSGSSIKNETVLKIFGAYTHFTNFEITNTETGNRMITIGGSNPPERRGNSVDDYGTGNGLINMIIHDTGQGVGTWAQGGNNEYYGNIIYNNGWDGPDRLNGHGTYIQNNLGYKKFEANILFSNFSLNSKSGGSDAASSRNISFIGNTFFNGRVLWMGPHLENLQVIGNYAYKSSVKIPNEPEITYINSDVRDNYFMSGIELSEPAGSVTFKNNTIWNDDPRGKNVILWLNNFYSPGKFNIDQNTYFKSFPVFPYWHFAINLLSPKKRLPIAMRYTGEFAFNKTNGSQTSTFAYTRKSWQGDLGFDRNGTYVDRAPTGTKIVVKPNRYDAKRAHITIYNWDKAATVGVDVSSILNSGDTYELRNAQDYFGDIIRGTYSGGSLLVPMTGRTRAKPIGYDQTSSWYHDPIHPNTFPEFGVFVLIRTNPR
jgi:hypothetical protein